MGLFQPNPNPSIIVDLNSTYRYPDLREITDYVLVYKAHMLRSLSDLFPNLAVIRGNNLIDVS